MISGSILPNPSAFIYISADEKLEEELRLIRQAADERNQAKEKEKQARLDAKLAKKEELKLKAKEEREKKKEVSDFIKLLVGGRKFGSKYDVQLL